MKFGGAVLALCIWLIGQPVFAHPGRTDSVGCHTCRTNCASWGLSSGEYHCHNAKATPQPEEPIHSRYGEDGTGYTEPAPEYEYQPPVTTTPTPAPIVNTSAVQPTSENSDNTNQDGVVLGASDTNDGSGGGWVVATFVGVGAAGWWAVRHRMRLRKDKTNAG